MCCPLFLSLTYGQRMLQADFHLLICLVCLRGPSSGKWPSDTSLTLDNPKLGQWSEEMVWFIFHSIKTSLLGTINETSGMRGWLLKIISFCYKCAAKKNYHQWPYTAPGPEATCLNLRLGGSHPSTSNIQHNDTLLSHKRQTLFWEFSVKCSRF